ncbi:MAG: FHA domain-containing protein [Deltaproteobacteria bacterium]|nr:FHA domain-containing protein [Deltaproteobacteria bacterium]
MAEVVVELNGKEILRLPLKGPTMTIGRDPTCDLHLDNRALSRRHAQIEKRGAAIWVRDLESQNGTFVNGERIAEPQALNGGDRIVVGRYEVRIDGVEQARRDTPVLTLTGPEGRHRFAMVGEEIIIGRAPSCDIAIGHKSISRRHMRIAAEGDHFVAEDLGSQNGSRINNKRINGPTPFRIGDKVQMSEFTIEVGFLESPETHGGDGGGPPRSGKTMLIDKSELAKAAYVDGDLKGGVGQGNISLGQAAASPPLEPRYGPADGFEFGDASAAELPSPPRLPPQPVRPPPSSGRPPAPTARPPPPAQPILTITHPDLQERELVLEGDVTALGEDGADGDTSDGRSFANQAYVVFVRTARVVVCTVAGDRRLLTVNGQPQLTATLREGDTIELGVLTVVFHNQG